MEEKILLIEDNPKHVALTLRALRKCHVWTKVVIANDGAEALDLLFGRDAKSPPGTPWTPKLVLLDLYLPKVDGFEVLRRIRASERTRLLPVVILTDSKEEKDLIKGYELGAIAYMRKPVNFVRLVEAVRELGMNWLLENEPLPRIGTG